MAKQPDLAILPGKGLKPFKRFLAIMKTCGPNMDGYILIRGNLKFTPFSLPEDRFYILVCFHDIKTEVLPVKIHNL